MDFWVGEALAELYKAQQPVAWMDEDGTIYYDKTQKGSIPLYAHPPASPQPAKVLTDEEIERIQDEDHAEEERNGEFDRDCYKDDEIYQIYMERSHAWTEGKRDGLRYARDNGYLAPAPVDIERIMEVFSRFAGEHVSILHHDFLADSGGILRERLTNALNPKKT